MINIRKYNSPCGILVIGSYKESICMCNWFSNKHHKRRVLKQLCEEFNTDIIEQNTETIQSLIMQLDEYFYQDRKKFQIPTVFCGTKFQKLVWNELSKISYGETISYGKLAERIGRSESVRAVANAVGANPLSIIVPCHRVIGSNGRLTGYAGGLDAKSYLLSLESKLF